jgi:hypothetical protein
LENCGKFNKLLSIIEFLSGVTMPYAWKNNDACTGTYQVLKQLDQFGNRDTSFEQAAAIKLKDLIYFPKTTDNPDILSVLSLQVAQRFMKELAKLANLRKEDAAGTSAAIISAIAAVFGDGTKTVNDLAAMVDAKIKFPDEVIVGAV